MRFLALDVETATSHRGSICQIGLVDFDHGVAHDIRSFFSREYGVSVESPPGVKQLEAAREEAALLAAMSRADGRMAASEVGPIVQYVVQVAARRGVESDDEDRAAITQLVKRMRPLPEDIDGAIAAVGRRKPDETSAFLSAVEEVILADGTRHPSEIALVHQWKAALPAVLG